MASLYERRGSPYFWLKHKTADGTIAQVSTRCRVGVAPEVRRARQLAAEKSLEELKYDSTIRKSAWEWVPAFLRVRYKFKPTTLERYGCAWPTIELFLQENRIESPAQLLRGHCFEYIEWRQLPDKKNGKYKACHNTALLELKILRIVMQEAVIRGFCTGNPCVQLGIGKAPRKLKPELTDEDCDLIRSEIPKVADPVVQNMLAISFEIARYQGCRLKETCLDPLKDVDLKNQTISFRVKGGKTFVTALHPKLVPLFQRLRDQNRQLTWTPPAGSGRQWASAKWFKFLDDHGLKAKLGDALCFHSTRVTAVTRLVRAGVPLSKAKNFIGHSSTFVHESYQRIKPEDLTDCVAALS